MHVQIINFRLEGVTEAEYVALCDEVAGAFADAPGLERKVWIANSDTGTYGGVYFWRDREAMETFATSELFATVADHPNFTDIEAFDFAVLEGPTRVTRGDI